jgi:hypothetical protein
MSNNLNDIVDIQIQIASPATSLSGFESILIVGSEPASKTLEDYKPLGVYTSLEGVKAAGWVEGDAVYDAAAVAFSQAVKPSQIYVAANVVTDGSAESLGDTLDRAAANPEWFVICPAGVDEEKYEDIAKWTEAHEKMACFTVTETASSLDVDTYMNSFEIFSPAKVDADQYINVAFAVACLQYEPGSETWAFKTLNAVSIAELTATQMQALQEANISYYVEYGGKAITQGGKTVSGQWIDVIRVMWWQKSDMQERIYNLFVTQPKIPYTDNGIAQVQNQIICSLKRGQAMGGIAPTEYDEEGNAIPGYTVTVPRARDLTQAERASRQLKGCKFTARLSGAIHNVEVRGTLEY